MMQNSQSSALSMKPQGLVIVMLLSLIVPLSSLAQLRYDDDYPVIGYSDAQTTDPFSQIMQTLRNGDSSLLQHDADAYPNSEAAERGYLDSLLTLLNIDPSSQLLVFSKSSLKKRFVKADSPRAIYFNDEVYVAYIANTRAIEIAAMDPLLGPVFFVLSQDPSQELSVERELNRCLRCHDSYSLSGGGVPRFLLSSVLANAEGDIVSHEISVITKTSTPLDRRWGGWYVSGTHGQQETMANLIIDASSGSISLDLAANGNQASLDNLLDVTPYPAKHSDIVALMVIEHQVELQNTLTKVNYVLRTLIDQQGSASAEEVAEITEPLVEALLMANEVALTDDIEGYSGFTEYFQELGPKDKQGRSLREFDLHTRTFKYPLSYLIYSPAFTALQGDAKAYVYNRITAVLTGEEKSPSFSHLSDTDRSSILAILTDTHAEFASTLP